MTPNKEQICHDHASEVSVAQTELLNRALDHAAHLEKENSKLKAKVDAAYRHGWQLAHERATCGHVRTNYMDPTYGTDHYTGKEVCEMCALVAERDELKAQVEKMREALQEISKGYGAYNPDPFEHAKNCIEDAKTRAKEALSPL